MREIKFRAWNGRKMFEVDVLAINGVSWDSGGTGVSLAYQPSVKVMEFTGLNDKEGAEIYEGDIGWDEWNECYGVVKFDEGKFLYEWDNICEDLFETHIEIVGNIYETPELLKV